MDLLEVGGRSMGWIDLSHDWDWWQALMKAVMNLRVPQNAEWLRAP